MFDVERFREAIEADESGWRITTIDGWTADVVVDEVLVDGDPAYDKIAGAPVDGVWDEGRVDVDCYAPYKPSDWATGYCEVTSRTEDGEWKGVRLLYGTEFDEDAGHPQEQLFSSAGVALIEPVPSGFVEAAPWAREYRSEAMEYATNRSGTLRRAVMVAACVRAAASEGRGDVWAAYCEDVEEPSLSGFVGWLSQSDVGELVDEIGEEMFPDRDELDASNRVLGEALDPVRYMLDGWGMADVDVSSDYDIEDEEVEGEDEKGGGEFEGEVTFDQGT